MSDTKTSFELSDDVTLYWEIKDKKISFGLDLKDKHLPVPLNTFEKEWYYKGKRREALKKDILEHATNIPNLDSKLDELIGRFTLCSRSENIKQSDVLIKYVKSPDVELFHDDKQDPYARIKINGHYEIHPIKGSKFLRWLKREHYIATGITPNSKAVDDVLAIIEGMACYDGKEYPLHNRACWFDDAIWYDLGNWEAVKITPQGWMIITDPPILFRHYNHQKAHTQIPPVGDAMKVLDFVNIKDIGERMLFLVTLVSYFVPDIPHPCFLIHGEKGSCKSSLIKILKVIVDPSIVDSLSFPKDNVEFIQQLSHHYYAPYDNITKLSGWESDVLCRAITGEGGSKRELYTNDEDFFYKYKRCIGLNGINVVATRPDLLDRSILIELQRVPGYSRKTEKEFWEEFENAKGEILSGILSTLSKAMAIYPTIKLCYLPRMADFAIWGCAIAEALGFGMDAFLKVYDANIQAQNREAIENNPVGKLILKFMKDKPEWEGTASCLYAALKQLVPEDEEWDFPPTSSTLSRAVSNIKSNLMDLGIQIEQDRNSNKRTIKISNSMTIYDDSKKMPSQKNQQADTKYDGNDGNDGIFLLKEETKKNTKNIIDIKSTGNAVIRVMPSLSQSGDNDDKEGNGVTVPSSPFFTIPQLTPEQQQEIERRELEEYLQDLERFKMRVTGTGRPLTQEEEHVISMATKLASELN